MKATVVAGLLISLLYTNGGATDNRVFHGNARSLGMAGVRVMLADEWSGIGNQAGLAAITSPSFSIHYENYFLVPALGTGAFSICMPTRSGTFGFCFSNYGYASYRENQLCLSIGKAFGYRFRAGIGLHYLTVHQPSDMGNLSALVPALGIQALLLPDLTIGLQVFNPACQHYVPAGYLNLPVTGQAGLGYQLGQEVLICFEAEKQAHEKLQYRGGIEINLEQKLIARFGIYSGEYPGYSFGIAFHSRLLFIDLAASRHPVLGFSPAISLSFRPDPVRKKPIHLRDNAPVE